MREEKLSHTFKRCKSIMLICHHHIWYTYWEELGFNSLNLNSHINSDFDYQTQFF